MIKKTYLLISIAILSLFSACERPSATSEKEGAGTCVPISTPDEFIILSWYELIDIHAKFMLEEFMDPSAEWRMRKLAEAGFNAYFDYRLKSLEEAEALLDLGDKVGMKIIVECPELHEDSTTEMAVKAMSAHASLYAYKVWDEPEVAEYPEVIRRIKEIYKAISCMVQWHSSISRPGALSAKMKSAISIHTSSR